MEFSSQRQFVGGNHRAVFLSPSRLHPNRPRNVSTDSPVALLHPIDRARARATESEIAPSLEREPFPFGGSPVTWAAIGSAAGSPGSGRQVCILWGGGTVSALATPFSFSAWSFVT
jgi:hypothetical protein